MDVVQENVISPKNVGNNDTNLAIRSENTSSTSQIDEAETVETIEQIGGAEAKKIHRFQSDVNTAQTAIKVGASLSTASSFVHGFVFVVLALFTLKALRIGADMVAVVPLLIGAVGLLISWAIVYALLSIVVTNALTAKHAIYQSSRL